MRKIVRLNLFLAVYLAEWRSEVYALDVPATSTAFDVTAEGDVVKVAGAAVIDGANETHPESNNKSVPTNCDALDLKCIPWSQLGEEEKDYRHFKWSQTTLERDLGWYYYDRPFWKDLDEDKRRGLAMLGYTAERWDVYDNDPCGGFERALAELRPWSRLTEEEQEAATLLGLNEYTWHTKEAVMGAWQPWDGEVTWQEIPQDRTPHKLMPNNGFFTEKLTLDIPEFKALTFDSLAKIEDEVFVHQTEFYHENDNLNDEFNGNGLRMPVSQFVKEIRDGKKYYLKYEDGKEDETAHILGDLDVVQVMTKYLQNTSLADYARIGPKYENEYTNDIIQFYIGGASTMTHMHLDIQSFNFLYIVEGRKRIRLIPNDQRTSKQFSWGYDAMYSVWTGYDLLHEPLPPEGAEFILNAGEVAIVPYHSWHAVENLEPTIAFGWIRDFPYTSARFDCLGKLGEYEYALKYENDDSDDEEEEDEIEVSDAIDHLRIAKGLLSGMGRSPRGVKLLNLMEETRLMLIDVDSGFYRDSEEEEDAEIIEALDLLYEAKEHAVELGIGLPHVNSVIVMLDKAVRVIEYVYPDLIEEQVERDDEYEWGEDSDDEEENYDSDEEGYAEEENYDSDEEENYDSDDEEYAAEENIDSDEEENYDSDDEEYAAEENIDSDEEENYDSDDEEYAAEENYDSDDEEYAAEENYDSDDEEYAQVA